MKKLVLIILLGFLSVNANAASEIYTGHSIRGMSEFTGEEITGFLADVGAVRVGGGLFGATHYAHVLKEGHYGPLFAGVGVGAVTEHPALDNHFQFTLTAGAIYGRFVFRWMHMSNGANIFQHGDYEAKQRNRGIDFFTVGVTF